MWLLPLLWPGLFTRPIAASARHSEFAMSRTRRVGETCSKKARSSGLKSRCSLDAAPFSNEIADLVIAA
jgi:hypothetical protein